MSARTDIVSRVDHHLRETGLSGRKFSLMVANDHKWLSRLRAGKVSLATIERCEALLAKQLDAAPPDGPDVAGEGAG